MNAQALTIADHGYQLSEMTVPISNYDGSESKDYKVGYQFKELHDELFVDCEWPDIKLDELYDFQSELDKLASIREDIIICLSQRHRVSESLIRLQMVNEKI